MLLNTNDYSEKEKALLRYFGISIELFNGADAPSLYRIAVERAFLGDMKGPEVESLRRCVQALNKCKIYRRTPEWEALINF